jgi:hypothetical protein
MTVVFDFNGKGGTRGTISLLFTETWHWKKFHRIDLRRLIMKRIILSTLTVLLLAIAIVVPAFAGANVTTFEFPFYTSFEAADPCTGNDTFVEISGTATVHEVFNDNSGSFKSTFKLRGTVAGTDLITGDRVSGPLVWNFSEAGGFDGPVTRVYNARITNPGPGNNLLLHVVIHISPNGVIHDDNTAHLIDVCPDQPGGN